MSLEVMGTAAAVGTFIVIAATAIAAVVQLRKRGGPVVWENFEYLVVKAREWNAKHAGGSYPRGVPRLQVNVTWPELA